MASAATSVTEAVAQLPRKFGTKQIFLPNHVIAFIRPKPRQPPNLATFVVPLQFNKLDLRDYLFHAYNVEVNGVRSFINQPAPRRKAGRGKWYRPRAQKMMIAELVKPFVWPEPPAESERKDFDYSIFKNMQKARDEDTNRRVDPSNIPLRTQTPMPRPRVGLIAQAEQFLKNGVEWSNGKTGDDKWTEVETDVKV